MTTHTEVLEKWSRRVWKEADESAIDEMFGPEGEARGLGAQIRIGPEGFKEFHRHFLAMMQDFDVKIDRSMESGIWLSALCMLHAKKRGTDEPVQMSGTVYARLIDGQIVEAYNHFDFMGLYQQLGLLPDGLFERCFCGERIG
jgi:hypothetical protein